jgi:hypothetical protein
MEFRPMEAIKAHREGARREQVRREEEKLQEAMVDIDPILQKISREGIQALTREEKEKLDRVSEMKRRRRGNIVDLDDYRKQR